MKFSEPQKLNDGRYCVKPTTDDDGRVIIQLNNAKLLTPFAEGDSVTLSISDNNRIVSVDQEIVNAACENSSSWFGREVQRKTIETAYQKSISDGNMNVYKFKGTKAFDSTREQIDPNDLVDDTECDVVVELVALWFLKKSFSTHWRLIQLRKKKEPKKKFYESYLFQDDGEEQNNSSDDDDFLH